MIESPEDPPDPRLGWLAAVLPATARRVRAHDPAVRATLAAAGAQLVEDAPDVELASPSALRADAPCAVVAVHADEPAGDARALRALQRAVRAADVHGRRAYAMWSLSRQGYQSRRVLIWERSDPLWREPGTPRRRALAHRLALNAVVTGSRDAPEATLLEAAVADAGRRSGLSLQFRPPVIGSSGVLLVMAPDAILRVAVGPARSHLDAQRRAVAALQREPALSDRLPALLASGSTGLAAWSLERRLPGSAPREPLSAALIEDCVDFLVALHRVGHGATDASGPAPAVVVAAAYPARAQELLEVSERSAGALTGLPRGYAHGDFWSANLLAREGRLTGVVDWAGAGAGRLALLDLLHLQVSGRREPRGLALGEGLRDYLRAPRRDEQAAVERYCDRLGLAPGDDERSALLVAYWLDALARDLRDPDRGAQLERTRARWRRDVDLVLEAVRAGYAAGTGMFR